MPDKTTDRWIKAANAPLKGKTVDEVRYLNDEELQRLGWSRSTVVIFFRDGTYVFPSRNDEGNDAGALFTSSEATPVLPVI